MSSNQTFIPNSGAVILAKSLKSLGVKVIFGIVGIPVVEVAEACISEGIKFVGCRNEQTASYAASSYGYLTKSPGVCLVVSGPGVIHALSGLYNAQANNWPMLLIGGSCESNLVGKGAFQELNQVETCRPYTKHCARFTSLGSIAKLCELSYFHSLSGRPGPTYLDFPADLIRKTYSSDFQFELPVLKPIPSSGADPQLIEQAVEVLLAAKRPLLVLGKGASYAQCDKEIVQLQRLLKLPFLPSPMGKGILSDEDAYCVAKARATALKSTDVVLILGARLNWMFQFGQHFHPDCQVIQVDIEPSEFHVNRKIDVPLCGDLPTVLHQLLDVLAQRGGVPLDLGAGFLPQLQLKMVANGAKMDLHLKAPQLPLINHHHAIEAVHRVLKQETQGDYCLVSEGARTMDVTRARVFSYFPRRRLDAGTLGVMGVGVGYAIASQLVHPTLPVVAILGDSAFGFSLSDLETCFRYRLPILFVIVNNNGIYHGKSDLKGMELNKLPSFALSPQTEYGKLTLLNQSNDGFEVSSVGEVESLVKRFVTRRLQGSLNGPTVLNVLIDPRPASEGFYWLNQEDQPKPKL